MKPESQGPNLEVGDGLEALILRAVYYDMVALAVEEEVAGVPMLGVWSRGHFFPIGPAPDQ